MSKNIVELNGNTYDVRTGKLVTSAQPGRLQPQMDITRPAKRQPESFRADRKQAANQPTSTPVKSPLRTKKSQALMRTAVQKPKSAKPSTTKQIPEAQRRHAPSHYSRLERAKKIAKSTTIQKFQPNNQHQAAAVHKLDQTATTKVPSPTTPKTPSNPINQAPGVNQANPQQRNQDRLEAAVASATSHQQTFDDGGSVGRTLARLRNIPLPVRYGFTVMVAVIALGTIGYVTAPRVSVHLAANRSGVAASLPSYRPTGFTLNRSVEYSPGQVTLEFESLSDNRNFRIHKASTDWTSEALRANFVEERGLYQTVENRGNTIYIYNGTNATWIDGGVWYNIEGASSLNSNQLLRIAESL